MINGEMFSKRVLLLNASHNDERLLRALKRLGCYVITTGNRPGLPGHREADEYAYGDYTDKEAMLALAEEKPVDAVCPCCNDFGVMTAAYVSEKMGFSGQDNYNTATILNNKAKFKEFAAELGDISTPPAVSFSDPEEASRWAKLSRHEFPLIVKPADLSAGNGICRADSAGELCERIKTAFESSRVKRVVIEPFIEGTQHGLCTYLINQRVAAVCSNNEHSFINPYRVEADTFPAACTEAVCSDLVGQIERIARALNLSDGIFHLQYILNGGNAYILECMRRVLGNLYGIPAEGLCGGFDWDYWEARAKCGFGVKDFPEKVVQNGFWAYRALIAEEDGVFDGIRVPPDIRRYVYSEKKLHDPGYVIKNHKSDPVGFLFTRFDTYEEMMWVMIQRQSEIKVLIKQREEALR